MRTDESAAVKAGGLIAAAALVVVFAGLRAAAPWLLPTLVGLLGAILALPLLDRLRAWRVPSAIAVLLTTLAGAVVVAGVLIAVERSLVSFIDAAPRYQQRLEGLIEHADRWLGRHRAASVGDAIDHAANPAVLIHFLQLLASAIAGVLSKAVLIFFITIFTLLEVRQIGQKIRHLTANDEQVAARFAETIRQIQRYLGLKTAVGLASGGSTALWAALLGVDFAPLWGLLSFVLGFIPNIGSLLSTIPPVLVALLQLGPKRAVATLVGYVVIQTIIGNVVEPRLMGRSFGLSPLVVFLALLFWGWLWGPVGMFLSVPLTMVLKIIFDNIPGLRWLGVLLGTESEGEASR